MTTSEREYLKQRIMEDSPEVPVMAAIHLTKCQEIADVFLVNRSTVRQWKKNGAPIAVIGGRLTAEYNMLMAWHVRRSCSGPEVVRRRPSTVHR